MRAFLLIIVVCFLPGWIWSQTPLDLEQCTELAIQNNIAIQQSQNGLSISEVNLVQRKFDFLPSAAAQVDFGQNIGAAVDNFSQRIAQSPRTFNPGLGATFILYNGFSKWNALKAAKADAAAALYSLEDMQNDIRLNVALAFFQVIFSQDNLAIARDRLGLVEKQLQRTELLFQAGNVTEGDVYTLKAQFATEKVNVVNLENLYRQNLLNLLLAMNVDPTEEYQLVRPDLEGLIMENAIESIETVYDDALVANPALKSIRAQIESQSLMVKVNRASFLPNLSMRYAVGSFYSSGAQNTRGFRISVTPTDTLLVPALGEPPTFANQLDNNLGQAITFSLNIPIYQNYRVKQAVKTAELNLKNTELSLKNEENTLYQSIVLAHQDAEAALVRFRATEEQVEATQLAFEYAQKRFEAGLSEFTAYLESLNTKTQAERELLQSQYDFILKVKVLELYQGKTIQF